MKKVSDLAVGEVVLFGSMSTRRDRLINTDLAWRKMDVDNGFCTLSCIGQYEFDSPERESESRERRSRGGNFFPESNLLQYINAIGDNWYKPAHDKDAPPSYSGLPGFLTEFSAWEIGSIVPHEIAVVTPNGYKRKHGELAKCTCLVSIPSASQFGYGESDIEGRRFGYCEEYNPDPSVLTRTANGACLYITTYNGGFDPVSPAHSSCIVPYIHLKDDLLVSDAPNADGNYLTLPPQGMFESMSSDLMQLLSE